MVFEEKRVAQVAEIYKRQKNINDGFSAKLRDIKKKEEEINFEEQ